MTRMSIASEIREGMVVNSVRNVKELPYETGHQIQVSINNLSSRGTPPYYLPIIATRQSAERAVSEVQLLVAGGFMRFLIVSHTVSPGCTMTKRPYSACILRPIREYSPRWLPYLSKVRSALPNGGAERLTCAGVQPAQLLHPAFAVRIDHGKLKPLVYTYVGIRWMMSYLQRIYSSYMILYGNVWLGVPAMPS